MLDQVIGDGLLAADRPVVVMLSGGRDSTCLLDLAVRIAGASVVTAVHANYGLRAAADADERQCADLCAQLRVALEVHRPPRVPAGNVQAWARDQRYGAATELALALGADLAAGHTATDQIETILYRLASSPSRRALMGMRPRDLAQPPLIRPLLSYTRAQTAAYCAARGLAWREDESNASDAYARNRIRRDLVPALERIHPAAQDNVLALAEILRDEGDVLDGVVATALQGRNEIELATLRELAPAVQRLVVQRLADAAARGPAAGAARRAAEVAALSEHGTASLDLPHGVRATAASGVLRFGPTPALVTDRGHQPGVQPDDSAAAVDPERERASGAERATGPSTPLKLMSVNDDGAIGEILVPEEALTRRVRELAAEVSRDYAGKDLVLIGVLKGAVFFLSDLMRALEIPVEVDFMAVASYGSATKSSGVVRILKDLDAAIEGRDVLIVEDIVDSGLTLQYLLRNLAGRHPRSLEVCALLIKPERRKVDLETRYVGFEIPDQFAIGYGLDHGERYRNLPYVAALKE